MELFLPDVNWQSHKWTSAGQVKKVLEEASEVAEALATGDLINAIRETLDTIQTGYTMLNILQSEWEQEYGGPCPTRRFMDEHVQKLERKGYL
jgi:hypothetical protein